MAPAAGQGLKGGLTVFPLDLGKLTPEQRTMVALWSWQARVAARGAPRCLDDRLIER
jgi:hypothetical protein